MEQIHLQNVKASLYGWQFVQWGPSKIECTDVFSVISLSLFLFLTVFLWTDKKNVGILFPNDIFISNSTTAKHLCWNKMSARTQIKEGEKEKSGKEGLNKKGYLVACSRKEHFSLAGRVHLGPLWPLDITSLLGILRRTSSPLFHWPVRSMLRSLNSSTPG